MSSPVGVFLGETCGGWLAGWRETCGGCGGKTKTRSPPAPLSAVCGVAVVTVCNATVMLLSSYLL